MRDKSTFVYEIMAPALRQAVKNTSYEEKVLQELDEIIDHKRKIRGISPNILAKEIINLARKYNISQDMDFQENTAIFKMPLEKTDFIQDIMVPALKRAVKGTKIENSVLQELEEILDPLRVAKFGSHVLRQDILDVAKKHDLQMTNVKNKEVTFSYIQKAR